MPIPEFASNSVPARACAAYAEHGAVILRQALSHDLTEHMLLLSAAAFAIMDIKSQDAARGRRDDPYQDAVDRYAKLQFIGDDVTRLLFSNASLTSPGFDRIASALAALLDAIFAGKPFVFVPGKSALRRQGTQGTARRSAYVVWHRDAHAVRTAELGECLNCWVPFQSVGIERPSLEIVVGSHRSLSERIVDYEENDSPTDDEIRATYNPSQICTAIMDPGDILIFGHHTLHRTQPMGDSYPMRMSGEFRFQEAVAQGPKSLQRHEVRQSSAFFNRLLSAISRSAPSSALRSRISARSKMSTERF